MFKDIDYEQLINPVLKLERSIIKYDDLLSNLSQSYINKLIVLPEYLAIEHLDERGNYIPKVEYTDTLVKECSEYDELLKQHYGDYMQLPPESERGSHHVFAAYVK